MTSDKHKPNPMTGTISAICTSDTKGVAKSEVPAATLVVEHGIEGDAHAGPWHRQVSFLDERDIDTMRAKGLDLAHGAFGENFVLQGIDLAGLGLGSRMQLGEDAQVSITQIGKVCHTHCAIYDQTGDCIMPRMGLFARVLRAGRVQKGDRAHVIHAVPRSRFQAVVITVSDRCASNDAVDETGPALAKQLETRGALHVYKVEIVPDECEAIASRIEHYCNGHSIDLVVTAGGTGMSPRDVTPEATRPLIERFTPGLDEAMRAASLSKTPHAALSRGVSGIRGSTLILSLPGSVRGATANLDAVLGALAHGLQKLRGDPADCGR